MVATRSGAAVATNTKAADEASSGAAVAAKTRAADEASTRSGENEEETAKTKEAADERRGEREGQGGRGRELKEELEDKIAKIRTEEGWGSGSRSSIAYREEQDLEATEEAEIGLEKNDIKVNKFEILWIPVTRRIAVQVPSI
ncbi:hypothetical protein EMIHUDRAFT_232515 [Emiliania huxleyi CCMP1516]|uniref:Uncharacterized protein n=2 Tax=Emiliania huxleyi TaxID=2903 RepID=A0A0D3K4M4_EMIH1|nr:hypothetical protein EMIHUDRAFT_232515 [Emiliania huxleyi CCMP1516]EOD30709.1 hypothetical protein EMIHUDRAFT_232515 [Emiliania huxleyi CCMP1516]|eukprot:XP_005783138.1 hypothetical protein EMIHUDRAFT_232515 [Emiliania huxleyi CCMP1516]